MNDSLHEVISTRPAQGGPHLGVLAVVSAVLLAAGIAVSAALGGAVPSPFSATATVIHYYAAHPHAVRASAVFTFGSAIPLAIYAATAHARLRRLGVTAPGATIALVGGVIAAIDLALSGLVGWVLSEPGVGTDGAVVRALNLLGFALGGPGHVVGLGLLLAGVAVPGLILELMSRPLAVTGIAIAAVCELTTLVLVTSSATSLLPLGRFLGLGWLIVVGFRLPHHRPHRRPLRTALPSSPASA